MDVVVLGLGVGGEEVAGRLAAAGLSVVGVERRLVGGECPYYACVPTKMMVRAADLLAEARRVDGMAGHADVRPDWTPVAHRIRAEATDNWNDQVAVDRLVGKGARFVRGDGRLVGPKRVAVTPADGSGERVYDAGTAVVLGAGTDPAAPPVPGLADTPYWTNRQAVEVTELPASLLILGGGPIGCEFAQIFARFGVRVTVLEAADRLLPGEEPESSALVAQALSDDGVEVRAGAKVEHVTYDWRGFTARTSAGELTGGRLLVATGRRTSLDALGIGAAGLDPASRLLPVDDHMRATDGLYAVGDVTEHGGYTHMAMYQADIAVRDILGEGGFTADYRAVPRVTFTDPEIGGVGLTEAQAHAAGLDVRVGTADLAASARGWIHKAGNAGLIKLVADHDRGVLVGATSAGPCGGEVLAALTLAVHAEVPLDRLASMITAYPTFHRTIPTALAALG
ncbi:pyridine nucleotide-disulfide oxidoreductase [Actinocatenispora rupis]|uniref:Pyridine nucleotide-disulfide oxidoreductase n=1 Tax=Actinocatenispora rupis TaxID=519421 RepID=A0A8J3J8P2_9ACTN|nr:pyridine nucleotide-disulfide oxidoreductase [Actinocatenispora rupis]